MANLEESVRAIPRTTTCCVTNTTPSMKPAPYKNVSYGTISGEQILVTPVWEDTHL